ncbi:peroxiredoxin family protein [Chryseobacterium sp. T20]
MYELKKKCNDISIGAVVDKKYYKGYTTLVENKGEYPLQGKLNLKVNSNFPLPYSFICGNSDQSFKPSALFTVSKEKLRFKLDSIEMFMPVLPLKDKSSVLLDDQYKFNASFSKLLNIFYNKEEDNLKLESLLVEYSKENCDSYMLFWTLVQHFQFRGFREAYFQSFKNLSPKIRNSEYGKMFYNDLINSLSLSEKSKFPDLQFQNKAILSSLGKSYTLVEFWFSHCKPCLEEIPVYKKIYSKYKNKGFEMFSISTDRSQDIKKWKEVIREEKMDWSQLLDENGIESKKYSINTFPTTFILDSNGYIIKKNVSSKELEKFLEKNLK